MRNVRFAMIAMVGSITIMGAALGLFNKAPQYATYADDMSCDHLPRDAFVGVGSYSCSVISQDDARNFKLPHYHVLLFMLSHQNATKLTGASVTDQGGHSYAVEDINYGCAAGGFSTKEDDFSMAGKHLTVRWRVVPMPECGKSR